MAGEETTNQGNIKTEYNQGTTGMNMDNSINQIPKGALTYALNAAVENFDASSINYQNEPGNEFCLQFPQGYQLIGEHFIAEQNKHIFFITNPDTQQSEIGYMDNNNCIYNTYISAPCLNFSIQYPIHKIVHKITNCTTEVYWTDGLNPRRYLDLTNLPYKIKPGTDVCANETIPEVDCNKIKIQPTFDIPQLEITDITTGGALTAGTYQFAIQYCDSIGDGYTSYYSVTNPTPITNTKLTTPDFNYEVGKSIVLSINNIDITGYFQYFNIAVIKTVNAITSVELVGTYFIDKSSKKITYTGQNQTQIRLSTSDIFEKFPYYDIAQDLTAVQDILVWDNLTSIDRINYQQIANGIILQWETYRIPDTEDYSDELNATNLRSYLRDEVYAFEIVFLLKNGKQTDGFHIPGRAKSFVENSNPNISELNPDFIGEPDTYLDGVGYSPYWKIYNTASVIGTSPGYSPAASYKGPYQYGEFAYWESTETYPCNVDVWGTLSNQPIRHHKFPDVLVSPIFESKIFSNPESMVMGSNAVFPIGVKISSLQIEQLISASDLTNEQKNDITGYKIVRGDRGTNKSIVAKGILRNVGKYKREDQSLYYPNYPYNDISDDPFLLLANNAYKNLCKGYTITATTDATVRYSDCNTNKETKLTLKAGEQVVQCAIGEPSALEGQVTVAVAVYDEYKITSTGCKGCTVKFINIFGDVQSIGMSGYTCLNNCRFKATVQVKPGTGAPYGDNCPGGDICPSHITITYIRTVDGGSQCVVETPLNGFTDSSSQFRHVFNSPETSFGQPFLGTVLKLENVIYGSGNAHHVQVRNNAAYKLLSYEAQSAALQSSAELSNTGAGGFTATAMFAAYQSYLTIYINGITRKNYAYSFNSIASYNYNSEIGNNLGIKQRNLDIAQYLIPGVQSAGDNLNINNWNRESSVYLKTTEKEYKVNYTTYVICYSGGSIFIPFATYEYTDPALGSTIISITKDTCSVSFNSTSYPILLNSGGGTSTINVIGTGDNSIAVPLPFPNETPSLIINGSSKVSDKSRYTISEKNMCPTPGKENSINVVSYYASLKNIFVNQWGQMYSYDTIDTGFQKDFNTASSSEIVFGGDTFISKFAFKTKIPFFIDNRVGAPDDSDIFYDEIGNVAYPKYWHSSRSELSNFTVVTSEPQYLTNIISTKAHNFDCPNKITAASSHNLNSNSTYYDGYFYLFAYGIPSFYCESSINVDLRQAFNNKEGDFFPHVSTGIPDDWLQESFVTIRQDNTYHYNVTYSKQNKENYFSHLPVDWKQQLCYTNYPFRAIYSDPQQNYSDNKINSWLIYRPISSFDFPQNYGKLTSLDGIQNKAILARFENKSLLYNTLLTIDTSNPQAAYMGNSSLFKSSPPIDFAETDLGYVGSQNKMLLKIPQGQITIDAKRGQVFLIQGIGGQVQDLSMFGSGMNRFFTDHLAFEILRYFPTADVDNHFNGIGLHGVYDSKFDRVIITKLDYIPLPGKDIKYNEETKEFYIERKFGDSTLTQVVDVADPEYFCNKSWTLSFNMNTKSWVSFHSYIPNFYIAENNFFYSGLNSCCDDGVIDVFAGSVLPPNTTTTSTSSSTSSTSSTTTSSTTRYTGCDLTGNAHVIDCSLSGTVTIL